MKTEAIKNELDTLINSMQIERKEDFSIKASNLKKIVHLLGNYEFLHILGRIKEDEYLSKFDYEDLCELEL